MTANAIEVLKRFSEKNFSQRKEMLLLDDDKEIDDALVLAITALEKQKKFEKYVKIYGLRTLPKQLRLML